MRLPMERVELEVSLFVDGPGFIVSLREDSLRNSGSLSGHSGRNAVNDRLPKLLSQALPQLDLLIGLDQR